LVSRKLWDGDDISGTGEFNDRWNLHGNPKNIHWSRSKGLPWYESIVIYGVTGLEERK
jgi:long-subunit fatty acid transport protein